MFRLSGQEPDDEEYKEFLEFVNADKKGKTDELVWFSNNFNMNFLVFDGSC